MALPIAPFEAGRYIGTVVYVEPTSVRLNLPYSTLAAASSFSGHRIGRGEVGEFVVIEGEASGILGRITQVRLLDGDRLSVEPTRRAEPSTEANPIGIVQLLLSIDLSSGRILGGISDHPRIGQYAYSAHPELIKFAMEYSSRGKNKLLKLAHLPHETTTTVSFSPASVFGRHCAVIGTTGGGKSWTLATLLGEVAEHHGKAILFDPSGEFHTLVNRTKHVCLGGGPGPDDDRQYVSFPYKHLSEADLFAMFQPSSGSQSPKLREALQSLKLLHLQPQLGEDGLLVKAQRVKAPIEDAHKFHASSMRSPGASYDITKLGAQIYEECIWPTGGSAQVPNPLVWGNLDANSRGYCTTLVSRVGVMVHSSELAPIFAPAELEDLTSVIESFLADNSLSILRVSMEYLPFEHHTRELVANALGQYLLKLARKGKFKDKPLIVAVDEAHQFLNKFIGDELNRVRLESFGLIAKEGRKYGLCALLATQRPRDIPEDVLSQMGMLIVHRLINERDRQIVEQACGSLDASAAAFLPILGQGRGIGHRAGYDHDRPTENPSTPQSS